MTCTSKVFSRQVCWQISRSFDSESSRYCSKDDSTNAVLNIFKGIKPAKLMALLLAFSNSFEEQVSYGDFVTLIERQEKVPHALEKRNIQLKIEKAVPGAG